MKPMICIVMLLLYGMHGHAQTWDEWFNQKKTQKKYLLQQIAALQVYLGYAKDGYGIAKKGLNTISRIKDGDLDLHGTFFSERKAVNPLVKRYSRLNDLMGLQSGIAKQCSDLRRQVQSGSWFSAADRKYAMAVLSRLVDDGVTTLDDAVAVATPGKLEMSDDERMSRIDLLYKETQDQYSFLQQFSGQLRVVATERQREASELATLRILHGSK